LRSVGDGEQGIELGQLEERPEILVEPGEPELTAGFAQPLRMRISPSI
jgi:hypothetical protein